MQKADSDNHAPLDPPRSVFELIHSLHEAIKDSIDTSLSWEDLNSPPVNYTVVRPLVKRFSPTSTRQQEAGISTEGTSRARHAASGPSAHNQSASDRFLRPHDGGEDGRAGTGHQQEEGTTLGAVLYALMANR